MASTRNFTAPVWTSSDGCRVRIEELFVFNYIAFDIVY